MGQEAKKNKLLDIITIMKTNYYIKFTLFFFLVSVIAFAPFWINGKSFIWVKNPVDGLVQHYNSLVYFGKWGREIIKNILLNHTLEIPMWDFSIGYGSDIIASLHYYVLGDPLNLLSIFVPSHYTEYLYNFLVIFRIYLAGVAFSGFCFYMKKDVNAIFVGAYIYMFCGYMLFAFARHPFFITPMVYFPLLLWGAEKILARKKPIHFIGIVFLMTISNFYFSYILLIFLIIYCAVRFFTTIHDSILKEMFEYILKFGLYIILGIMMASVIFIPVVIQLFSGERLGSGPVVDIIYHLDYYEGLLAKFITSGASDYFLCEGFVPVSLVSLILLFLKRKRANDLKIVFIICTVILLLPMCASVLNGMSYPTNRWLFAYAFFVAYIFVTIWPEFFCISRKELSIIMCITAIYFILLLLVDQGVKENTMASMVSLSLFLIALSWIINGKYSVRFEKKFWAFTLFLTVLSIGVNVKYQFGVREGNYISQFIDCGTALTKIYNTGALAVRKEEGEQLKIERIDDPVGVNNSSWQNRTYGLSYYGSVENGNIASFLKNMGIGNFLPQMYRNLDSRTMVNTLQSVKYYTNKGDAEILPFGYTLIDESSDKDSTTGNKYFVAENQYALPVGYCYDNYLTEDKFYEMSAIEKQQALLQGVLLDEDLENFSEAQTIFTDESLDYKIEYSENVWRQKDKFIVSKDNATITLLFDGLDNCETYVYINGILAKGISEKELYFDDDMSHYSEEEWSELPRITQNRLSYTDRYYQEPTLFDIKITSEYSSSTLGYQTENYNFYYGREEYVANMGYHKNGLDSVTITFPKRGEYEFGSIEIICQPMEQYIQDVEKLKGNVLEDEKIGTNALSGNVFLDEDKIFLLTVPYSEGWHGFVDGREVELLKGNVMNIAIPLEAGDHTVEIRYITPGLHEGAILSFVGIAIYAIIILWGRRKRKTIIAIKE